QVKNTDTTCFNGLPACCQKVCVQVANTSRGEVGAVITGEQIDLVVQIENVVVDGWRCQENELFTPAITSAATIGSKDIFELEIALGASITEIVGFVHENHIHVSHLTDIEIIDSEALLSDHICRDGGTTEFVLPHRFQRCRTDDQCLLTQVISIIFQ